METLNVLRLAQLHNQMDKVYHEMNSKEKVKILIIIIIIIIIIIMIILKQYNVKSC